MGIERIASEQRMFMIFDEFFEFPDDALISDVKKQGLMEYLPVWWNFETDEFYESRFVDNLDMVYEQSVGAKDLPGIVFALLNYEGVVESSSFGSIVKSVQETIDGSRLDIQFLAANVLAVYNSIKRFNSVEDNMLRYLLSISSVVVRVGIGTLTTMYDDVRTHYERDVFENNGLLEFDKVKKFAEMYYPALIKKFEKLVNGQVENVGDYFNPKLGPCFFDIPLQNLGS